jgi:hypothetical protein
MTRAMIVPISLSCRPPPRNNAFRAAPRTLSVSVLSGQLLSAQIQREDVGLGLTQRLLVQSLKGRVAQVSAVLTGFRIVVEAPSSAWDYSRCNIYNIGLLLCLVSLDYLVYAVTRIRVMIFNLNLNP